MFKLEKQDKNQVKYIYEIRMVEDFPKDELKPLDIILTAMDRGFYEFLGLFDGSELIGYVSLVNIDDDYLVDYLATLPRHRNKGAGSELMRLLEQYLKGRGRVIVEVENPDYAENDADRDIQTRRLGFYKRNGCVDTGLRVRCFGVPYIILEIEGISSKEKTDIWELYQSFYKLMLPKDMYENNIKLMTE